MKSRIVFVAAIAAASLVSSAQETAYCRLTADNSEVVIPRKAWATVQFAAQEMTNLLSEVFGKSVPLVHNPTQGRVSIILGTNEWSAAAGIDVSSLPRDGFIIRTASPDRIYIAGEDACVPRFLNSPGYSGTLRVAHATVFGVYEFLERFADARFYYPGELGTILPRADVLSIPKTDFTDSPDYTVRCYYNHPADGVWFCTGPKARRGKSLNWMRTRMETASIPCCHGTIRFKYLERFGKTHPEYFALKPNGTRHMTYTGAESSRNGHLCWTSGITNELFLDARSYLKGEPASVRGIPGGKPGTFAWGRNCEGGKYVDVMPNDSFQQCSCENCVRMKIDDANYANDIVWRATAGIAQRLIDEGIPGYITQMSYHPYSRVPDFQLPTNILVMVAKAGPFSKYNKEDLERQFAGVRAWREKTGRKVWIWTYPGKWGPKNFKNVPQMCPRAWGEYYRDMAPYIIGAFAESESDRWFYNHLNYYVFGKVCWRNSTDIEALLDEYYSRMYGPAAPEVKKFFDTLELMWLKRTMGRTIETPLGPQCRTPSVHDLWTKVYTPEIIAAWQSIMKRAESKVAPGSLEARRLQLVKSEMLDNLANASRAYHDSISVEHELKRRAAAPEEKSIISNGDFDGPVKGRFFSGWYSGKPPAPLDSATYVVGGASCRIEGSDDGDVVTQYLPSLKPNTRYRLSFFLKLDNLQCKSSGGGAGITMMQGFNHSFPERTSYTGTMDWTHCCFELTTDPETNSRTRSYIRLRLSAGTSGTAWFDGVRLVELGSE